MVAKTAKNIQKGGGKRVFKNSLHEKLLAWKNGTDMSAVGEVAGIPETAWCGGGDIISFPSSLSPAERRIAHQLCLRLDLFHASSGEGENRFVTVSKSGDFESIQQSTTMDEVTSNYCIWYDERSVKPLVKAKYFSLTDTDIQELQKSLITAPGTVNERVTVSLCSDFSLDFELKNLSHMSHMNAKYPEGGKNRSDVECEQDMDKHHTLVDTVEALQQAAAALSACFEVAFDLELHSYRTYHGLTCLIQLSGGGLNYIVDPLAPLLWDLIGPLLGPIFANPNIVMIGHGIMGGDIPALFRDFGIIVVNAFDTQEASGFLGRTGVGLAALLDLWGCPLKREIATLKDRMKHADWRLRPLTDVMLRYATLDVHYLVSLYKLQVRELLLSSVACMGKGNKTGYQGQDGIPLKKRIFPPKGKGNVSVPKECSSSNSNPNANASQEKSDGTMKKKDIVVTNGSSSSSGGGGGMRESVDDDQSERLEINDDSLAVHMLLDIKNRGAATAQDIDDDDEDDEGAEVWGLDPAVEVEVGMDGNTSSNNNKSKLNYVNDRFHNEAGGEDDDDDIGEAEDDENGGILAGQCIELEGVEGDDDDDDLWDGWGEEAPTQDPTQSLTKSESPSNLDIHNLSVSKISDTDKKGEIEYKSESKYEKNNNKKSSKNGKEGEGGVEKGTGSACKPVSSRAQQQQKRKEMKALKFEREKAKRLETIMIKAQKLQLYEEEKKARNQKELDKKKEEEKVGKEEKSIVEKEANGSKEEVEVKIGEKGGEKVEKIGTSSSASAGVVDTPLSVTKRPVNKETVEEIKIEVKKEEELEKEKAEIKQEEKDAQKNQSALEETQEQVKAPTAAAAAAAATTGTKTTTAAAAVVVGGVETEKEVVKEVVKEGELSDGHASPEYGDSDGMEEEDEEEDIDHEVEVEVGAKNVPLPSAEEDDDDALLKRRTLGQGFLRDIMAEYDRDRPTNKHSNSSINSTPNGGVDKGTQEQEQSSQQTFKSSATSTLPPLSASSTSSPSSPSAIVIATLTAADLGLDPRLSELLGALSASQQSCLKLWSPKKVSENAYTKVSGFSQRKKTRVGGGQWELKHVFVFRRLFLWREKEAERRDESPSYICRGSLLLDAAEFLPVTVSALMKLQSPLPASMRPSGACKGEVAQDAGAVEGGEGAGKGESVVKSTETGTEGAVGVATTTSTAVVTTTENGTEKVIAVKLASEDSNDSQLHIGDIEEPTGSKDDVVDLVAAVKAALRSWDAVIRKQNNSPATDRPDDSSPESYREKHVKRSTYHNKNNSQNLEVKNIDVMSSTSYEKVDVDVDVTATANEVSADVTGKGEGGSTATCARSPGSGLGSGVILDDSTVIAENSNEKAGVTSTTNTESSVTNTSSSSSSSSSSSNSSSIVKKSVTSGASITLLCAATILSIGAFIFLRRKA